MIRVLPSVRLTDFNDLSHFIVDSYHIVKVGSLAENRPSDIDNGGMLLFVGNNQYGTQYFFGVNLPCIYMRHYGSGSFGEWIKAGG